MRHTRIMDAIWNLDTAARLALALGIGLLVGVERGWHTRDASGGARVAGVRTYALAGLLGGVAAVLSQWLGMVFVAAVFLGFTALLLVAYRAAIDEQGDFGLTSEVAALLVFMLGAMAILGDMAIAAACGVVVAALLDAKRYLHRWVAGLSRLELDGAIQLLIISVVILPVLPNRGFGPGGVLNPFTMWLMVVFVAGLSFVGYIAIRKLGARLGALATAVFGGLASSTALTLSFARLGAKSQPMAPMLGAGIGVASAMMYVRVLIVVGAFNPKLIPALSWPLGAMAAISLAGAAILHHRTAKRRKAKDEPAAAPEIDNPTDLSTAVKFGLLLGVVALLAHYGQIWLGDAGVLAVAGVSGLADVDAITLNMAQMAGNGIEVTTASRAIIIAVGANTLVKAAIVWAFAGKRLGLYVAYISLAALGGGALGLVAAP